MKKAPKFPIRNSGIPSFFAALIKVLFAIFKFGLLSHLLTVLGINTKSIPQYPFASTSPKMEHSWHFSSCQSPSNRSPFGSHPFSQYNHLSLSIHPHFWKSGTATVVLCACDSRNPLYIPALQTSQSSPRIFCNPEIINQPFDL